METDPPGPESPREKQVHRRAHVPSLQPAEAQAVATGAPLSPKVEKQHVETRLDVRPGDVLVASVPAIGIEAVDEHDGSISRGG